MSEVDAWADFTAAFRPRASAERNERRLMAGAARKQNRKTIFGKSVSIAGQGLLGRPKSLRTSIV